MDFILNCFRKPTKLDAATLECQDASTSGAIIDSLRGDAGFGKLSTFEGDAIVQRDEEDAEKLQKGVDASVAAGVLPKFCLLYTSPSPRDMRRSRMPSSA